MKNKLFFYLSLACLLISLNTFAGVTFDPINYDVIPEPEIDDQGHIKQKIIHRINKKETNPQLPRKSSYAPPDAGGTSASIYPITYHGGPVMTSPNINVIWYGNWNQSNGTDTQAGQNIIKNLLSGLQLNDNGYVQITTSGGYTTPLYSTVSLVNSAAYYTYPTTTSYSKNLRDSDIKTIVLNSITKGGFTNNASLNSNIYLVLTSSDVSLNSGFCSKYCGWHTYTTSTTAGATIKYAFIGNSARCLSSCAAQSVSPNSNPGVDGMASVIAHEIEETVTDPVLNAWFNSNGAENADMCSWTFGNQITQLPNGSYWNVGFPSSSSASSLFLLQRALKTDSRCYISPKQQ